MPILAGDRLIGRLDPRLDRKTRRLLISLLQLEPGVRLSATMRTHLMRALDAFKSFHDAEELTILRTDPPGVLD